MSGESLQLPTKLTQSPFDYLKQAQATWDRGLRYRGWEITVKPFLDPDAPKRLLDHLLKNRKKEGEETDATIIWGAASNFDIVEDNLPTVTFVGGDSQPPPTEQQPLQTLTYTEVHRTTHKVRVENPDDSDQWVEVENTDDITFIGPDNILRKFVFKNQS